MIADELIYQKLKIYDYDVYLFFYVFYLQFSNHSSCMFVPIMDMERVPFIYGNNIKPKRPLTAMNSFLIHIYYLLSNIIYII